MKFLRRDYWPKLSSEGSGSCRAESSLEGFSQLPAPALLLAQGDTVTGFPEGASSLKFQTYRDRELFSFHFAQGTRDSIVVCVKNVFWFLKVLLLFVTLENIFFKNMVKMLESIRVYLFNM